MDSLLAEFNQLVKRRPSRLLAIGIPESRLPNAGVVQAVEALPSCLNGDAPYDLVIWRSPGPNRQSDLARIPSFMAERSRLIFATDSENRRDLILNLSRLGFAIHDERSVPKDSLHLVIARPTKFTIRPFEEGDEQDILRMFKPSFHAERSLDHWRWKFENHPLGTRMITIARDPDGLLAAHYAGYPVTFSDFTQAKGLRRKSTEHRWSALQIGDTMTLPQFRTVGRGPTSLLGRCVRHFFAMYCEGSLDFNFGFNTGNIQKFSRLFVNATPVENVGYWIRPVGSPSDSARSYRISSSPILDKSWSRFFERVGSHYGLLVRRDEEWLRWRYEQCPDGPPFLILAAHRWGRMVGWGVFRRRENRLRWCDALFDPKHVEATWPLLRAAMQHPSMQGVEEIEAWFPTRPEWWRRQLVILGFEPAQQPDSLALMTSPLNCERPVELLKGLYYTMGDSDLV